MPLVSDRIITKTLDRRVNDAQNGIVFPDQGDIHGELSVAFDELAGAVKGVHQPILIPGFPGRVRDMRRFLGHTGISGVSTASLLQITSWEAMSALVRGDLSDLLRTSKSVT